jgi:hypothetical protein
MLVLLSADDVELGLCRVIRQRVQELERVCCRHIWLASAPCSCFPYLLPETRYRVAILAGRGDATPCNTNVLAMYLPEG